jgi:hypothetical protein
MTATAQDIKQLLDLARVKLIGVSDAALKAELFTVLDEFFKDSSCWTETVQVQIVANTTLYNVVPNGGQIVRLAGVVDVNNIPQPAIMPEIGTIQFGHAYNNPATFYASLVKTVSLPTGKNDIPVIPDWVIQQWRFGLLDGLLGNLKNTSIGSYADPKKAPYHLARFRKAIGSARVSALRRNTIGTQAWRFPQGFQTSSQIGGVSVGNDTRFR